MLLDGAGGLSPAGLGSGFLASSSSRADGMSSRTTIPCDVFAMSLSKMSPSSGGRPSSRRASLGDFHGTPASASLLIWARDRDSLRLSAVNANWRLFSGPPNDASWTTSWVMCAWITPRSGRKPRSSVFSWSTSPTARLTSCDRPRSLADMPRTAAIFRTR